MEEDYFQHGSVEMSCDLLEWSVQEQRDVGPSKELRWEWRLRRHQHLEVGMCKIEGSF